MQLIWTMITDFTENFKNSIKGKYDSRRTEIQQELSAGAVIKMMVYLLNIILFLPFIQV